MDMLLIENSKDSAEVRAILEQQRATFEQQLQKATTVEDVKAIHVTYTL